MYLVSIPMSLMTPEVCDEYHKISMAPSKLANEVWHVEKHSVGWEKWYYLPLTWKWSWVIIFWQGANFPHFCKPMAWNYNEVSSIHMVVKKTNDSWIKNRLGGPIMMSWILPIILLILMPLRLGFQWFSPPSYTWIINENANHHGQ